jgi:LPS export ABC transporter protein LptC
LKVAQIKLLRRALVAVILIVLMAVGVNYIQTWRRRGRIVQQAAKILSTEMLRSADGIEYSEHENGIIHFKLRAERLLETRQGINLLEGIDADDFNPDGSVKNHIRSNKGEYDRENRKASFFGDVRIRVGEGTELRTDSLHYDLGKNAGRTDDRITISSSQAHGSARGAAYDHSKGSLELKSDLDFVIQRKVKNREGIAQTENLRVRSSQGYYSETAHVVKLTGKVGIESESASLACEEVEAAFSPDKKRITSLICNGSAVYISRDAGEVRTLRGDRMVFGVNPGTGNLGKIDVLGRAGFSTVSSESEQLLSGSDLHVGLDPLRGVPTSLEANNGVDFTIKRAQDQTVLRGDQLAATFAAESNQLQKMRVRGAARMSTHSSRDGSSDELSAQEIRLDFAPLNGRSTLRALEAEQSVNWVSSPRKPADGKAGQTGRALCAASLKMHYSSSGEYLESGSATGKVTLAGIQLGDSNHAEIRKLNADSIKFQFYPIENRLRSFEADDHVEVFYNKPPEPASDGDAQEFHTASSHMRATFRESDGTAESVRQWGNFIYRDGARTATSASSDYDAAKEVMILTGSPKILDETATTTGDVIQYDQAQKVLSVRGGVRSVLSPRDGGQSTPFNSPSDAPSPSVVTSELMEFWTEASRVRYSGKVQMLSENSQLSARALELRDGGSQVEAEGEIRHLLLRRENENAGKTGGKSTSSTGNSKMKPTAMTSPLLVQSARMKYLKEQNSVHYSGNVTLQSDDVWMNSESLDAVFGSDGKSVERAAARGKLQMRQAGREIKGQNGDYYLNLGKCVVTGDPAEIRDPEKVKSVARRLTFFTTDDRILVENP